MEAQFMRRDEAAAFLGVSTRTVSEWQAKRIIPFAKLGRKCVLFKRSDLEKAVDRFTVRAVGMV